MQSIHLGTNYSAREVFNITGTLPADVIECMVNNAEDADSMRETIPNIEEAKGCFPNEDFIEADGVISDLRDIAARVRGENKAAILAVMEKLEALQLAVFHQSEYGRSELTSALTVLEGY
jgi:hypothetical protein